jgi:hypothetical protein
LDPIALLATEADGPRDYLVAGKDLNRLKPSSNKASPPGGAVVPCDVVAHGSVRASAAEVRQLRQNLLLPSGERLSPAFLKHAEDQTVAGLVAVCRAINDYHLMKECFDEWGVLGAPRYLGRVAMMSAIQKFILEGAWGLSPHLIPHRLLHALSGAVSQALKIRGPNFGVGGGPSGVGEALLTAAAMLDGTRVPGLWVVLTGCDPEPNSEIGDGPDGASAFNALALALVAGRADRQGLRLRVCGQQKLAGGKPCEAPEGAPSLESLQALVTDLTERQPLGNWIHHFGNGLTLERVGGALPTPTANGSNVNGNGRQGSRAHVESAAEKQS